MQGFPGGVPPEHIWNMDEKGIQMGGGRKKSSKKFYFFKDQKQRYRISSDNLELVTILECISAAGENCPTFILSAEWQCTRPKGAFYLMMNGGGKSIAVFIHRAQ